MNTPVAAALFRPALVLMTGRGLGFIAAFAIPVVLARAFDVADFGTYKQLFLVAATLFGIAQLGMAESLYYFLPQQARDDSAYVSNAVLVLGIAGVGVLLLLWLLQDAVARLLNNPALAGYLPLAGLYLLLTLPAVALEIVMTVRKQHVLASTSYALSDAGRAVLLVVPVLLLAELYWLVLGAIAYAGLRLLALRQYLRHVYPSGLKVVRPDLRRHLAYALPFGLAGLLEVLQMNYHLYAVSWYFDTATFAIYAVGCLQIPLIDFLATSTCNVMMVNMREGVLAGDHTAVQTIWLDSIRKLALVFFPLVCLLLMCAEHLIVLLFTSAYRDSVPIFMVWSISMLFATLLTDGALRVFAENRFLIFQNLVRLLLIVVLIHWFMQRFGLAGAILVTLVATAFAKVLALWRLKRVMALPLQRLLPWTQLLQTALLSAAAMLPVLLSQKLLDLPDLPALVFTGTVYSFTYYLLLQSYGPMHADERRMLADSLRAPFVRFQALLRS